VVYSWDLATAAEQVREGLPAASLIDLQERLELSAARLGDVLSIAPRTLARRAGAGRLPRDESERVYRLGRLTAIASEVLGGIEAAREWFKAPNYALGDRTPLDMASTEPGAQLVERTLRHIEHGIPV
jgi:putative toxin-antitoxin system antitoxin component (TIGR02293 family)